MNREAQLRLLREATVETYQLGLTHPFRMIPPTPEYCVSVPAGPVRFVVEARELGNAETLQAFDQLSAQAGGALGALATDSGDESDDDVVDDYGASLHIFGADDGMEHLRFDCFAKKPHYHYVRDNGEANQGVRLDQFAEGDPVEWTIRRLACRLPEMLDYCGQTHLAEQVRREIEQILPQVDRVAELLREARERAAAGRQTVAAATASRGGIDHE